MITLTKDAVFAAARKAYENKQLSAQGPAPRCQYVDPVGLPCAVGAAIDQNELTDEQRTKLFENEIGSIGSRSFRKIFNIPSYDEEREIADLQSRHDAWAAAARTLQISVYPTTFEKEALKNTEKSFVTMIYGEDNG